MMNIYKTPKVCSLVKHNLKCSMVASPLDLYSSNSSHKNFSIFLNFDFITVPNYFITISTSNTEETSLPPSPSDRGNPGSRDCGASGVMSTATNLEPWHSVGPRQLHLGASPGRWRPCPNYPHRSPLYTIPVWKHVTARQASRDSLISYSHYPLYPLHWQPVSVTYILFHASRLSGQMWHYLDCLGESVLN